MHFSWIFVPSTLSGRRRPASTPLSLVPPASPHRTFLLLPEMFFAPGLKVARSSPAEGL